MQQTLGLISQHKVLYPLCYSNGTCFLCLTLSVFVYSNIVCCTLHIITSYCLILIQAICLVLLDLNSRPCLRNALDVMTHFDAALSHWIYPFHKFHGACYPTMDHFVTELCIRGHITVPKWCIVRYGTVALWDLWDRSIRMLFEFIKYDVTAHSTSNNHDLR